MSSTLTHSYTPAPLAVVTHNHAKKPGKSTTKAMRKPVPNRCRAICRDCDYVGLWRDSKDKIKNDGMNHRKKPGCERHRIDYLITVQGALIR